MCFINLYFLLNQINFEIIAEGKLGEENKNFANLYNIYR